MAPESSGMYCSTVPKLCYLALLHVISHFQKSQNENVSDHQFTLQVLKKMFIRLLSSLKHSTGGTVWLRTTVSAHPKPDVDLVK